MANDTCKLIMLEINYLYVNLPTDKISHTTKLLPYFPAQRGTFSPEKCDINLTCVLCAEGKYYFQTYKYPYIYVGHTESHEQHFCVK